MNTKRAEFVRTIVYIAFGVVLYLLLSNLRAVGGWIAYLAALVQPILMGLGIAFLLNLLLKAIEESAPFRFFGRRFKKFARFKRPLSLILTYVIVIFAFYLVVDIIAPQISSSFAQLGQRLPGYGETIKQWYVNLNLSEEVVAAINDMIPNTTQIIEQLKNFLPNAVPTIFDVTASVTGGVADFFVAVFVSVYVLATKERLLSACSKLVRAVFSERWSLWLITFMREATVTFEKFFGAQFLTALILGLLCFAGMSVFRFPYAPLISLIIGLCSLIPIFGAFIGTIPSALLILLEDPMKALWFVVFFVVLNQVVDNTIYPILVGDAIGISGFWVLVGLTIGGNLCGVVGMLLGVPVTAVVYSLVRRLCNNALRGKGIKT